MSLIKIRQEKSISQGISGKCIKVIYNLYDSAKSKIKLNGVISKEYFLCNVGVRQGENLSPLLSLGGKIAHERLYWDYATQVVPKRISILARCLCSIWIQTMERCLDR